MQERETNFRFNFPTLRVHLGVLKPALASTAIITRPGDRDGAFYSVSHFMAVMVLDHLDYSLL